MTEELKACPFCGGEAEYHTDRGPTGEVYGWVGCNQCDAMSCHIDTRSMQPEETHPVYAWNTRATDAENQRLRAEVEALREADAEALAEATSLAIFLCKQHYRHVPQWKPLPDTRGVISQIDNMTAGMRDRLTAMKAAGDGLAGFAGHTDDCRAVLAAWGEIEACSCGYTDAWKQWKEASDGL